MEIGKTVRIIEKEAPPLVVVPMPIPIRTPVTVPEPERILVPA